MAAEAAKRRQGGEGGGGKEKVDAALLVVARMWCRLGWPGGDGFGEGGLEEVVTLAAAMRR